MVMYGNDSKELLFLAWAEQSLHKKSQRLLHDSAAHLFHLRKKTINFSWNEPLSHRYDKNEQ